MRHYFLLLLCSFICINLYAQAVLPKPDQYYSVVDKASLLKADEFQLLSKKLDSFKRQTEHELVVVIIPSLGSLTIEEYANKLFNNWGIGQKEKNNGILLLLAINNRKMRIETGYGVEDKITDTEAAYIIDNILKPNFKSGNFYQGLVLASDFLISELSSDVSHKNYFDTTESNSSTYKFNKPVPVNRIDSINPWIVFVISFLSQLIFGIILYRYFNIKKLKEQASNILVTIVSTNLYYITFLFSFCIISSEVNFSYSISNKVFILSALFCAAIYGWHLLPKKVKKNIGIVFIQLLNFTLSAFLSVILSMLILVFGGSYNAFLTVCFILTAFLYILSLILKLGDAALEFYRSASVYNYTNNNSSSYNSTSYNNSSSGSSGSSFGGGSSGGGGASGSW